MIQFHTDNINLPKFPKRVIGNWIKTIAEKYNKRVGEIVYIFCTDKKIRKINRKFLSHNGSTDVITFDYSTNNLISGDIFISIDTVLCNATYYKVDFQNELFRVMIHGILHLCEIQDDSNEARTAMEKHENEALVLLYKTLLKDAI